MKQKVYTIIKICCATGAVLAGSIVVYYFVVVARASTKVVVKQQEQVQVSSGIVEQENINGIKIFRLPVIEEKPPVILFLGDVMLGRDVARRSRSVGNNEYPFEHFNTVLDAFEQLPNLIVANLEGPITASRAMYQKSLSFAFDPDIVHVLKKYNFGLLSLANNHGLDQGKLGYEDTKKYLADVGIKYFGHGAREEYEDVWIEKVGSTRIAIIGLNLTDHRVADNKIKELIEQAAGKSDVVVVFVHWGVEYERFPSFEQKRLARLFIDSGVDAVIGHHPHVVQTIEEYKSKIIFYSLGNFIFDQYFSKETQEGLAIGLTLTTTTTAYQLIPYTIPYSQPTVMNEQARNKFLKDLARDSKLPEDLTKQVIGGMLEMPHE